VVRSHVVFLRPKQAFVEAFCIVYLSTRSCTMERQKMWHTFVQLVVSAYRGLWHGEKVNKECVCRVIPRLSYKT